MSIRNYTLGNAEKLKSRSLIEALFNKGYSVRAYPIKIQFLFHKNDDKPHCQMGVTVPKKNFKHAVDRNKIKRQLREAFRLQKGEFYQELEKKEKKIGLMIIYLGREKVPFEELQNYLSKCIKRIKI